MAGPLELVPVVQGRRRVDPEFRRMDAVVVPAESDRVRKDQEAALRPEARGNGPQDFLRIIHVHIMIHHHKVFQELEEEPPTPPTKAARMFPLRKKIYSRKDFKVKEDKSFLDRQKHKFNIWEKYNIVVERKRNNIFKERTL